MPLPTDTSAEWPPPGHQAIQADIAEADAWWTGDPAKLNRVYGAGSLDQRRPSLAARLWGRPQQGNASSRDGRVHAPIAADIATTSADLLFGEDLGLTIAEAHTETPDTNAKQVEERLLELADLAELQTTLLEGAEVCSGLGGVYLRATWDPVVADHPLLDVVHADRAVPTWRSGQLQAVTFWTVVEHHGQTVWRHLQVNEPGVVLNGLYAGNATHLGTPMALDRHPATKGLPEFIDLAAMGITGLLPSYVPNLRPNRKHRGTPIGQADTAGSESMMDSLDETMTSWARDIRVGKARVIVPDEFLDSGGRGGGSSFDTEREVFSPLNIDPTNMDRAGITPVEFEIRAEQHAATAVDLATRIFTSAGYNPQSFGLQGDGSQVTATEIRAREGLSLRTTGRKQRYWRGAIARQAWNLLAIDRAKFSGTVDPMDVTVTFPDLTQTDIRDLASTLNLINLAQAASIETKVQMLHPEWEPEQVTREVEAIKAEQGLVPVDDPTGGLP